MTTKEAIQYMGITGWNTAWERALALHNKIVATLEAEAKKVEQERQNATPSAE